MLREYSAGLAATIVLFALITALLDYGLSIPTVVESYNSGVCVEVLNYPGVWFNQEVYSCENMPSKFYHVWAE